MPRKPWKTVSLLERLQNTFRAAPNGLTLDDVMAHLAPPLCEHGVEAEFCLRLCEGPGRLEARIFEHCLKSHGPYLKRQRPKWVRTKLEELIGLGLMHKEVSPQGFRYYAHEKLFALFYGLAPVAEEEPLVAYRSAHEEVWLSPDAQAPRQLKVAREAQYEAAREREKERARALMLAGKIICPFCKGAQHQIAAPDHGISSDEGLAQCLGCNQFFDFSITGQEVVKTRGGFHCQWHPHVSRSGQHYHQFKAASVEELLARGWLRFPWLSDQWMLVCNECLRPERQQARRAERLRKETGRLKSGQVHCPHCGGTRYRLGVVKLPTADEIERERAEFGAYLYSEVRASCLNPECSWAFRGSSVRHANLFYLPEGHRWRACSCRKHVEIPEHETSTRCACGKTLWLNYEDDCCLPRCSTAGVSASIVRPPGRALTLRDPLRR